MFYTNLTFIILLTVLTCLSRCLPLALKKHLLIIASLLLIATWGLSSLGIFMLAAVIGFIFSHWIFIQSKCHSTSGISKPQSLENLVERNNFPIPKTSSQDWSMQAHVAHCASIPNTSSTPTFSFAATGTIIPDKSSVSSLVSRISAWHILTIAITFYLLLLVLFKYREFLLGDYFPGVLAGPIAEIGIPLGISFYCFHIISYLIDVYRGHYQPAKFFDYLFYLSFFPHVIAGPIVRGWQLLPQLNVKRKVARDLMYGLHLLSMGLFLKTVCADNIGGVIDPYWSQANSSLSMAGHWLVAVYYYFQLYGDFAGYSLMACGMARLLGYRLPINFYYPMFAVGFQDFWRRWHITLSRWLKDYLYIPLGGNRLGMSRTCLNLLIVMALGGLWHGAAWTFFMWGILHGLGLLFERLLGKVCQKKGWKVPTTLGWFSTQMIVLIGWVYFRSPSLNLAHSFLGHMLTWDGRWVIDRTLLWLSIFTLPIIFHHLAPMLVQRMKRAYIQPFLGILTAMSFMTALIVQSPSTVFIYFAF